MCGSWVHKQSLGLPEAGKRAPPIDYNVGVECLRNHEQDRCNDIFSIHALNLPYHKYAKTTVLEKYVVPHTHNVWESLNIRIGILGLLFQGSQVSEN